MKGHANEKEIGGIDSASVERFLGKMRRRETLRLVLMTVFLVNALGAAVLSLWVWLSHDPAAGFLVPALVVDAASVGLLVMLWRRSNRIRRLCRASAKDTSRFLGESIEETRQAIREHRLLLLSVTAVLTPLFAIATWQLAGTGKMAPGDVVSIAGLYAVGLATVVGVTWNRLKRHLAPRERWLRRLLSDYRG